MIKSTHANTALFIGAHADDIELGAGGTVLKLAKSDWEIFGCILTTEDDPQLAATRKAEAIAGLARLGIAEENVLFTDFPDGRLAATRETIGKLRSILAERRLDPTLIFTHTDKENHNDHRAAHEVTLGTFRNKPILCYGIIKSLIASTFRPRVFTDISRFFDQKIEAFRAHQSQLARINTDDLAALDSTNGARCGFTKAEAFELILQQGSSDKIEVVWRVNDCPFHRFWYNVIRDGRLIIIHAVPVHRPHKEWNWPIDKDREGIEFLQRAFTTIWVGGSPIENYSCATENVEMVLGTDNILLSGGSVSNSITRNHFDHFAGLRYHIHYDMPGYRNIRIMDRKNTASIRAQYRDDSFGSRVPIVDCGIITVLKNPVNPEVSIVGCMGIHGYGSLACFKVLGDRRHLAALMELSTLPAPRNGGYQVLVEYPVAEGTPRLLSDSFHWVTYEEPTL